MNLGLIALLSCIGLIFLVSLVILIQYTLKETRFIPKLSADLKADPIYTVYSLALLLISLSGIVITLVGLVMVLAINIPEDTSISDRLDLIFSSRGHDLVLAGIIILVVPAMYGLIIDRG